MWYRESSVAKILAKRNSALFILSLVILTVTVMAQTQLGGGAQIQGYVRSKAGTQNVPLPGAIVTATDQATNKTYRAITEVNGTFILKVGATGKYHLTVDMTLFSSDSADVEVTDAEKPVQKDFDLSLLSQAQRANRPAPAAQPATEVAQGNRGGGGRGGNQAQVAQNEADQDPFADLNNPNTALLPGMTRDAATESIAQAGNIATATGNSFDPRQLDLANIGGTPDAVAQQFGAPTLNGLNGNNNNNNGGRGNNNGSGNDFAQAFGNNGGGNRGGGGRGGRGGNNGNFNIGGQRGRNANPININLSYTLRDSALDAKPFSLTGQQQTKPNTMTNTFSSTVGGPLGIPGLLNSQRNTFNVTYSGSRSDTPSAGYQNVPTLLQRQCIIDSTKGCDLSQTLVPVTQFVGGKPTSVLTPVTVYDPLTGQPFANNIIPADRIDSVAKKLLDPRFIPLPNNPSTDGTRNYYYLTTATSDSDNVNFQIRHQFAQPQRGNRGQRGNNNNGGGGGRGGGGRGGRGGGTLNVQVQFSHSSNQSIGSVPAIGGSNLNHGLNTTVSYARQFGRIQSTMNFRFNKNHTEGTNLYVNNTNIAQQLGITGVSQDPGDWGLPTVSFVNFSGLSDRSPTNTDNKTFTVSETMRRQRNNHNIQWGADFTRTINAVHSVQGNPRGSFTFNGQATGLTQQNYDPITGTTTSLLMPGTGLDFADFLLGYPQQTLLAYGADGHTFLSLNWDAYIQDDWRLRRNLTLQVGLRYEYVSPYKEANNHLVGLDVGAGFTEVAPVHPGTRGLYSGASFPETLVKPDRNNFMPRIGLAWNGPGRFVIRTGYGISYNAGAYSNMANSFARQPPFNQTTKNCVQYLTLAPGTVSPCAITNGPGVNLLSLENGFPSLIPTCSAAPDGTCVIQNTYGVDPNYRIGYAQQWTLDLQHELPGNIAMDLNYIGVKGTKMDVMEAPNRTNLGTARVPSVISYTWLTSQGDSMYNGIVTGFRRRMTKGIQVGVNYTFSKFMSDATGFSGAGRPIQDAFNRRADRALDSSDKPHVLAINWTTELPFGTNKPFLHGDGIAPRMIGNWLVNGTFNYGSGSVLTPSVSNSNCDYAANGTTLRPDFLGGRIALDHPTTQEWFNTSLFTVPTGCLGNAGKSLIRGPHTRSLSMTLNKSFPITASGKTLDVRIQANNALNMVTWGNPNVNVNSYQFGQITNAGGMRTVTIQARYRF
jgi:uncharacterized membrane protein YgcG